MGLDGLNFSAFKAYDIRGKVPEELDERLAYNVGLAYAAFLSPKCIVVGRDIRATSQTLAAALIRGLNDAGVNVADIGVTGTEGVYFAVGCGDPVWGTFDGGIMVTASHNPPNYNGMKLVREGARPISADTGLREIARIIEERRFPSPAKASGACRELDIRAAYTRHLLGYVDLSKLKPLKVVVNAGNGGAGLVVDLLEPHLPFEFIKVHHEPDGTFPHGVPNPMLEENRAPTSRAIEEHRADLGLAWDGDFDRCFFFDNEGRFIEGYYLVGLLATAALEREPSAKIVHDPRLTWNTIDIVRDQGGVPVLCRSGHAFIKQKMREVDAAYGGEMSAHHYFRDFAYCDSGMIPWLQVLEIVSASGRTISDLVQDRIEKFPCSGEINLGVPDVARAIAEVERRYALRAMHCDRTDGLSLEFEDWRFNLRGSNTEPLLRLNVETRGNSRLLREKTEELLCAASAR